MNCQYCNNPVPPQVSNCPSCGAPVPQQNNPSPDRPVPPPPGVNNPVQQAKNPTLAALLSCLVPGLGQLYNGQTTKGIVIILANIALGVITGGVSAVAILIVAIIDALKIAEKINRGATVGEWEFF